jgi:hypothetical protein
MPLFSTYTTAEGADLAVDAVALHVTAQDRDDPAYAGADLARRSHLANPRGDGEDVFRRKLWGHRTPVPYRYYATGPSW